MSSLAMSGTPQGLLDSGFDVPAVLSDHGVFYGLAGQIQHLEQGAVKGDEIFADQAVSGLDILIKADLKKGANGVIDTMQGSLVGLS
jgi:hypothetical protein